MLARVGEVKPEQFGVAAALGEGDGRREPDQIPAKGDRGVPQRRVPADPGVLSGDVYRVVAQSCTTTTVSLAPSSTTNSTLSAYVPEPRWSSTTTACANRSART